jgi:hypothetical protein
MTTTPPASQHLGDVPVIGSTVEAFFAQLGEAQARFVRVVSEAGAWLDNEPIELAELAAHQARLTQQLFDAQRSILRRRADVESGANCIAERSELEAQALVDAALRDAAAICTDLDEVTAFGDVLAMRRHGRDPTPPVPVERGLAHDETGADPAEQQLQALLDQWWRMEVERGEAMIDGARARAAVRLHLAEIEAGEIHETARAVSAAPMAAQAVNGAGDVAAEPSGHSDAIDWPDAPQLLASVPTLPMNPPPMVCELGEALDLTDQAGLDALLVSFIDALREPPADADTSEAPADETSNATAPQSPDGTRAAPAHVVATQDAFDRFWGSGHGRAAQRGTREWVFVQILLPMVAVVAVLTLVLAWIG